MTLPGPMTIFDQEVVRLYLATKLLLFRTVCRGRAFPTLRSSKAEDERIHLPDF
jgi:hypothetical protein